MLHEHVIAWAIANAGKEVRAKPEWAYLYNSLTKGICRVGGYSELDNGFSGYPERVLISEEFSNDVGAIRPHTGFVILYAGAKRGFWANPEHLEVVEDGKIHFVRNRNMRIREGIEALEKAEKAIRENAR